MPRRPCTGFAENVFHVVNRAAEGQLLFRDFGEFLAYRQLLAQLLDAEPMRLLAYCLMPNHVHFLLWPRTDAQLATFMRRLTSTHARRLRRWRGTVGRGAVYQNRYFASVVDKDEYLYRSARYIERNPVRAGFVERPEDYLWSSASFTSALAGIVLAEWPIPRLPDWRAFVNGIEPPHDLELIRERTSHGERIGRIVLTDGVAPVLAPTTVRLVED